MCRRLLKMPHSSSMAHTAQQQRLAQMPSFTSTSTQPGGQTLIIITFKWISLHKITFRKHFLSFQSVCDTFSSIYSDLRVWWYSMDKSWASVCIQLLVIVLPCPHVRRLFFFFLNANSRLNPVRTTVFWNRLVCIRMQAVRRCQTHAKPRGDHVTSLT